MSVNAREAILRRADVFESIAQQNASDPSSNVYHVGAVLLRAVALAVHPNVEIPADTWLGGIHT